MIRLSVTALLMLALALVLDASTITSGTIVVPDCGPCAYGSTTLTNVTSLDGGYTINGTVEAEYLLTGSAAIGSQLSFVMTNYIDNGTGNGSLTLNGVFYPTVYLSNCCEPEILTKLTMSVSPFTFNGAGSYSVPFFLTGTTIQATNSLQFAPPAPFLLNEENVQGSGVVTFTLGADPNNNSTAAFVFSPAPEPSTILLTLAGLLALLRWRVSANRRSKFSGPSLI